MTDKPCVSRLGNGRISGTVVGVLFFIIILVGFVIRWYGIGYGLPSVCHEESLTLRRAWNMHVTGNLSPGWFKWPTLLMYFELIVLRLLSLFRTIRWSDYVYANRFVMTVFGTALIGVSYAFGTRLYGRSVGIVSAALVAAWPWFVIFSRLARPEIPLPFLTVVTAYASLGILSSGRTKYYVIAGVSGSLAAALKYNGIFALIIPISMHLIASYRHRGNVDRIILPIIGFIIMPVATFLLTSPYAIWDYEMFFNHFIQQESRSGFDPRYVFTILDSLISAMGWAGCIAAGVGLVIALIRRTQADIVLVTSFIASIVLLVIWEPSIRLLSSAIVFLSVFGAMAIVWMAGVRYRYLPTFSGPFLALATIGAVFLSPVQENIRLLGESRRISVTESVNSWLKANTSGTERVYFGFEAPFPETVNSTGTYFPPHEMRDPDEAFNQDYNVFRSEGYEIVILSERHRQFLTDISLQPSATDFYRSLYRDAEVQTFPWDRLASGADSAPNSNVFRNQHHVRGAVYVLRLVPASRTEL